MREFLQDGDFRDEVFVELGFLDELLLVDHLDRKFLSRGWVECQLDSGEIASSEDHFCHVVPFVQCLGLLILRLQLVF